MYKSIQKNIKIDEILKELSKIDVGTEEYDDQINKVCKEISEFYSDGNRHSYSEVSMFFLNMQEDDKEYLYYNLDSAIRKIDDLDTKNKLYKLKDHIRLEELRMEYIKNTRIREIEKTSEISDTKIKEVIENYSQISKKISESNEELNNQKKSLDGLNNQIISVIGIFSAIVITFFGGAELFSNVFGSIGSISKYRLIFISIFISFVMFNTIFMLLNIISKLLEKEIVSKSCNGYKKDDEKCQNCQYGSGIIGFFICIIKKYPIVFLFDIVCIMLFL
ncbi:MAG: hypothetical protein E7C54_16585, partial [Clostridioides difficile]|nr:hypothetical protein [Clostridioides difficile]